MRPLESSKKLGHTKLDSQEEENKYPRRMENLRRLVPGGACGACGCAVIIILIIFAAVVGGVTCEIQIGTNDDSNDSGMPGVYTYSADALAFTFDYPEKWEQVTQSLTFGRTEATVNQGLVLRIVLGITEESTGKIDGIIIEVARLGDGVFLNGVNDDTVNEVDSMFAQLSGVLGAAIKTREDSVLGGLRSRRYRIDFSAGDGSPVTSVFNFVMRGNLQIVLNCQSRAEAFATIIQGCEKVFDSFRFR